LSGRGAQVDPIEPLDAVPEPGWKDRLDSAMRAARALFATRAAIFREELAEKGSLFGKAAVGLTIAALFGVLALLLLTALIAALFAHWFGGPVAGITAALVLYLVIAGVAGFFGLKSLARVRPFDFPVTRDEVRRDLDAVREEPPSPDEGPASPVALAAERASIRPGDADDDEEEVEEDEMRTADLEERLRAGSE
jgi:uncharacterized membrane protein YqjE